MRVFQDGNGESWVASVGERAGDDYKGRYYFRMAPQSGAEQEGVALTDVRWNRPETAERTLQTMSVEELRRRLGSARGRAVLHR
jgi:hypothetical protein